MVSTQKYILLNRRISNTLIILFFLFISQDNPSATQAQPDAWFEIDNKTNIQASQNILISRDFRNNGQFFLDSNNNPHFLRHESSSDCVHQTGTGTHIRVAIVPWRFDDLDPLDVQRFESLASDIANGFSTIEPYASNLDRISIWRADDYRGKNVTSPWYNSLLIQAAGVCNYNQILVIANNSGWAGGAPGYFSVVGSGTPDTCDPVTCTGEACPFMPSCSWDENIVYTALHETGHTFAGLRHTCYPSSIQEMELASLEKISGAIVQSDDPINCGVGFSGNPEQTCSEWDNPRFSDWVFPEDSNFGCYLGCDDRSEWYRAWNTSNIMCRDDFLENGFTPVDRRLLFEALGGDRKGYCDWFPEPPLAPEWEWVDPLGDSQYFFNNDPGHFRLQTPDRGHDLYLNLNAPRLLQRVGGDFSMQTRVFIEPHESPYQGAGLLVWQDEENYIRLERKTDGVNFIYRVDGNYVDTGGIILPITPIYLKIEREGNTFTAWFHNNNDAWIQIGNVSFSARQELKVGIHLVNEWQDNPVTADFEYFELDWCAAPLLPSFEATPLVGATPLRVSFTNTTTGTYYHNTWYFGDDSTSAETNPIHIYTEPGFYSVILSVLGPDQVENHSEKLFIHVVPYGIYIPLLIK